MTDVKLDLIDLTKQYSPGIDPAVDRLNMQVQEGHLVALLGPSGCGKSTLLLIISGLEQPDGGVVRIGNRDVTSLDPATRTLAFVFQSYALYPH